MKVAWTRGAVQELTDMGRFVASDDPSDVEEFLVVLNSNLRLSRLRVSSLGFAFAT